MPDPYETLQVSRNAEIDVIEAAYRRLARKYHPDVSSSSSSTARMQAINAAYEILKDPEKRWDYDRAHPIPSGYSRPRSEETFDWSDPFNPYIPRERARSYSKPQPRPAPKPKPNFFQRNWVYIVLIIGVYLVYFLSRAANTGNAPLSAPGSSTLSAQFPAGCIHWTEAGRYDGQKKCVIGRIVKVDYQVDDLTGYGMWTAHFSLDPENDFTLISVGNNISDWDGQCVVAYGTLLDREEARKYDANPPPAMVDSDPLDERGFSIAYARSEFC